MQKLIVLVVVGVRVYVAAAVAGFFGLVALKNWDIAAAIAGTIPHSKTVTYPLSVLPLFILIGFLAFYAGLTSRLFEAARRAFVVAYRRRVRVRRMELRVHHVEPAPVQLDLFAVDPEARLHRLMHATDRILTRFGDDPRTLLRARSLLGMDRSPLRVQ